MDTSGVTDEDEFTRLSDFHPDRVDLVKNAANGTRFLIAKQDAGAGLLDPDFVRGLIAKTAPEEEPVPEPSASGEQILPNGIVIKGSPAAMAAFIHAASAPVAKADMSTGSINDLPDSDFGYIESGGKKDESGRTTPRSLRHFPLNDAAHVRNALARAPQSPFGDKAMPKIRAAAKREGIDVAKEAGVSQTVAKDLMDSAGDSMPLDDGMDGMDPTVPLAAPDGDMDMPGDPADPGSPAWEAIDAATASKWLSILARAKNALCLLAEREMTEAAVADPSDAEHAFSLEDAACAVDYAISCLAVFAAGEQAEAETGAEMAEMCKALASFDLAPVGVIEGLTAVAKAGRVLSSANEAKLRSAAQAIGEVLSSLPQAPEGVAKSKEALVPAVKTRAAQVAKETASPEAQAADTGPVNAGGTTGLGEPRETGPAAALPGDGPQKAMPGDVAGRTVVKSALALVYDRQRNLIGVTDAAAIVTQVAKADGDGEKKAMQAVFDQDGDLIGIVDPDAIQPVTGAGGKPAADDGDGDMQPAAAADDMTPQPPADAGTPADEVVKAAQDVTTGQPADLGSIIAKAVADALGALPVAQDVAKSADVAKANARADALEARIAKVEETPAAPRVFTNGAVPPAHQLRGQDQGGQPVDVAKAQELRRQFRDAEPAEQNRIATEMQGTAIDALAAIHGRR